MDEELKEKIADAIKDCLKEETEIIKEEMKQYTEIKKGVEKNVK